MEESPPLEEDRHLKAGDKPLNLILRMEDHHLLPSPSLQRHSTKAKNNHAHIPPSPKPQRSFEATATAHTIAPLKTVFTTPPPHHEENPASPALSSPATTPKSLSNTNLTFLLKPAQHIYPAPPSTEARTHPTFPMVVLLFKAQASHFTPLATQGNSREVYQMTHRRKLPRMRN
jgi:hypothetical protein